VRSRSFYEFQSATARSDADSAYAVHGNVVSICDSPIYARTAAMNAAEVDGHGLGAARGVFAAVVLEAGMFLFGYALWLLWHLIA
jgi:hypothetical protein